MTTGSPPKIVGIVPARFASERFPGKVIAELAGRPLVVHTYERATRAASLQSVVVATDDTRVVEAIAPYGIEAVLTSPDHTTGTDRIAEVARGLDADIVVNVQADEPLLDPLLIDRTVAPLLEAEAVPMATARHRIHDPADIHNPNCVKVVCDQRGRALYFSRSPIPHLRAQGHDPAHEPLYWQHVGIYAFRRAFLIEFAAMPPTPLESIEKLEQLRVLEHGYPIAVVDAPGKSIGVDTPEDLARAEAALHAGPRG